MRQPVYYYRRRRFRPVHFVILVVVVAALAAGGFSWWFLNRGGGGLSLGRLARRIPPTPPAEWAGFESGPGAPGAMVVIRGPHDIAGHAGMTCSPLPPRGLQIALRTGSPELPVVVFRFATFPPAAGAAGELLVTGRSGPALASSRGSADLTLQPPPQQPAGSPPTESFAGILRGRFQGEAGSGEVEARLRGCATAVTAPLPPWSEPYHLGDHAADTDGEQ